METASHAEENRSLTRHHHLFFAHRFLCNDTHRLFVCFIYLIRVSHNNNKKKQSNMIIYTVLKIILLPLWRKRKM